MKQSLHEIYKVLHRQYGYRNWWPIVSGGKCHYLEEYRGRARTKNEIFEIMIGALLTQNTAWDNVVKTLIILKNNKMMSVPALRNVSLPKLASSVRPSGYYNQKAKKIKHLIRFIDKELRGDLTLLDKMDPKQARQKLLDVWGIGPETADSILLYGYDIPVFVVDAYTKRIFSRIGYIKKDQDYESVRKFFEEGLKKNALLFKEYHAVIVEHGKNVCKSRPVCGTCVLRLKCASVRD